MLKILKVINNLITKIAQTALVFFLSGMVLLIFVQVIYRYIIKEPLSWSEELATYFFSGIIFFGAVFLYREEKHINMSMALDAIKNAKVKKVIKIIADIFIILFLCAMTFYTYPLARDILALGGVSPSMEWLKLGWIFMIVPVGSMLSLLMMLEVLLKTFVEKEGA
ncbi:TRAP transporter small permease [Treponema sp.]|jgi:C4-dicarboxylate transport system (permease small protein)|uniref:TRAP transporter small permease n=1 Tax=Treponema sp. TaxID=166 RepID=UPI003FA283DF